MHITLDSPADDNKPTFLGAIIGGVIGGLLVIIIIIFLLLVVILYVRKLQKKHKNSINDESYNAIHKSKNTYIHYVGTYEVIKCLCKIVCR